jgi:hypothetical protein
MIYTLIEMVKHLQKHLGINDGFSITNLIAAATALTGVQLPDATLHQQLAILVEHVGGEIDKEDHKKEDAGSPPASAAASSSSTSNDESAAGSDDEFDASTLHRIDLQTTLHTATKAVDAIDKDVKKHDRIHDALTQKEALVAKQLAQTLLAAERLAETQTKAKEGKVVAAQQIVVLTEQRNTARHEMDKAAQALKLHDESLPCNASSASPVAAAAGDGVAATGGDVAAPPTVPTEAELPSPIVATAPQSTERKRKKVTLAPATADAAPLAPTADERALAQKKAQLVAKANDDAPAAAASATSKRPSPLIALWMAAASASPSTASAGVRNVSAAAAAAASVAASAAGPRGHVVSTKRVGSAAQGFVFNESDASDDESESDDSMINNEVDSNGDPVDSSSDESSSGTDEDGEEEEEVELPDDDSPSVAVPVKKRRIIDTDDEDA